ncbi:hypothetical protein BJ166DRAFT_597638 [Pestalotiopsis sp. NC0098]|nr:hypothetical protein BJ166DRAFT_597638 [Pestalotiopsis sp. NC0098]
MIHFFTTWELWQEMTFVLACSIVLVFFAGLGKLWWINRSVRKHEQLDEEKKTRMSEIEKVGIPPRRRAEIPFGVRAIQSGIEVDGIWISRPGTPNSQVPPGASSLTLTSETDPKGKAKVTTEDISPSLYQSSAASVIEGGSSPPRSPATHAQQTYRPKHATARSTSRLSEAHTVGSPNQPEAPVIQTYVPKSTFATRSSPTQSTTQGDRTSSSSEEAYIPSRQSSIRTHSRMQSAFPELRGYFASPQGSPENPFTTPEGGRTRQASDVSTYRLPTGVQNTPVTAPTRSYSGETHANRASRRVNEGFEVLPAGTFGPDPTANGSEVDLERGDGSARYSRPVMNKLQKRDSSR